MSVEESGTINQKYGATTTSRSIECCGCLLSNIEQFLCSYLKGVIDQSARLHINGPIANRIDILAVMRYK
jgi:hypothetical protein